MGYGFPRRRGRVIIGEHTDSGGFVFPVAIGHNVAIVFKPRIDRADSIHVTIAK